MRREEVAERFRGSEVPKPTEQPVPRSPEPEDDSVRAGKEKLERVKPY